MQASLNVGLAASWAEALGECLLLLRIPFGWALLVMVPVWILLRKRAYIAKRGQLVWGREILVNLFFIYSLAVAAITVFPIGIGIGSMWGRISWVPFTETHWLLHDPFVAVLNLVGNIVLFVPLGFFLPLLSPRFEGIGTTVLTGLVVSACIESLQFIGIAGWGWRSADIDDLILNTVGTAVGYGVYAAGRRVWQRWFGYGV